MLSTKVNTLILLLIISMGYNTMVTWNFLGASMSLIVVSSIIALVFLINVKYSIRDWSKNSVLVAVILIFCIYISMLFNSDFQNGNYLLMIKIILGLVLANSMSYCDFRKAFSNAMYIVAVYSLVCTYILKGLPIIKIIPMFYNVSGIRFYNFGLCSVIAMKNYYRNFGVFSEPGMYVCFLTVAMAFAIIDSKVHTKKNMVKIIILAITLATTFSPVGIACASVMLITYLFLNPELSNKNKLLALILIVACIWALFNIPEFKQSFEDSVDKFTEKQSSYIGRTYAIWHNLRAWIKSPFYGLGLYNMVYVFEIEELRNMASSNTSTTTMFLATYGIIFAILHVVGIFKAFNLNNVGKICCLAFFLSINSQALLHSELIWYLTLYGFAKEREDDIENFYMDRRYKKLIT